MIKTNQFSPKTQYVTPWCKCVELRSIQAFLIASKWGNVGEAGGQGSWTEDEDEDY